MSDGVVICSAPAKVILFGEQVVVLGRTAIATALDLRTYARLEAATDGKVAINLPDLNTTKSWTVDELRFHGPNLSQ